MTEHIASVVVVGHVDHGKSTFIGRLLHDTGSITADRLKEAEKVSADQGRKLEYAYLLDQFQEEREANITIDTTQAILNIGGSSLLMIDAPGHKEYLKNMITGATQARSAVLLLDVNEGVKEQTDKHARILKLLGIRHVAVLINKMDMVGYAEKVFHENEKIIQDLFRDRGLPKPIVIPIAAYNGENVSARADTMKWYTGPIAIDFLKEAMTPPSTNRLSPLRLPVQMVYNLEGTPLVLGRIENGSMDRGQKLKIFPSNEPLTVERIRTSKGRDVQAAETGENVALTIKEEDKSIRRGDILISGEDQVKAASQFEADVFWAGEQPLQKGDEIKLECRSQSGRATAVELIEQLDNNPLAQLAAGDVGRVKFKAGDSYLLEPMDHDSPFSRIVFQRNGQVVGCGVVSKVLGLFLILVLSGFSSSHAYVDPGTGVTFVSGIGAFLWGLITIGLGALVIFFKKLKNLFKSKK